MINFFHIQNELDDDFYNHGIDQRILQVCEQAEDNYDKNKKLVKEIQDMKKIIANSSKNQLRFKDAKNNIENKSINRENKKENNRTKNSLEFKRYLENVNQSINFQTEKTKKAKISKISPYKASTKDKHLSHSDDFKCLACHIKEKIKRPEINSHKDHINFKSSFDISKLILDAKKLMKTLNYNKAYETLKLPIAKGLVHSDIFYLFGEVCRILNNLEESQFFLLKCLKFEFHSPYVFYSLSLLNQELAEYKLSIEFMKRFIEIFPGSPDAYFQLAKCYFNLKNYLKSGTYISKAIDLNKSEKEYYHFRSSLYELMGFTELAMQDHNLIRNL